MLKTRKYRPGVGEAIVAGIGQDVRTRRELGPSVAIMQRTALVHEYISEVLRAKHSRNGSFPFDVELDLLPVRADRSGQSHMEAAIAIHRLIAAARDVEGRKYMGSDHNWRFRMEVLASEAVEWKKKGAAGGKGAVKNSRTLERGEIIHGLSGTVGLIASDPDAGGRLVMDFPGERRGFQTRQGIHITGLVSPETGEPNVDLQIMMRG